VKEAAKKTIYTIGYASFLIDEFLDVLKQYNIDCLIDVRSSPYSGYYKDFDKEYLENKLKFIGKYYRNYAREFGARQESKIFSSNEGYLDFEKFTQSEQFNDGVAKLKESCTEGYNIVLMCAEKDPINCHRSIMIGRALKEKDFDVEHILANKELESQTSVEEKIVIEFCKKHKVDRYQSSLFPDAIENLSDEQILALAYKEKNAEIGYRRGEE
jgi:uncharacterized protein (DUF488 family)